MYTVYLITSKTSGKQYVGLTSKSIERRFYEHVKSALNPSNKLGYFLLCKAIRKYGAEDFMVESLHSNILTFEEAAALECSEILRLKTFYAGYNMTLGGQGHSGPWTEEQKKAQSDRYSNGKHPMIGCKRPDTSERLKLNNPMKDPAVAAKHSERQKGQPKSLEANLKISETVKRLWSEGVYDSKKLYSEKGVAALRAHSAAKKGQPRPEYYGDLNPSKRPEVRAKMSASAKARYERARLEKLKASE